MLIINRDMEKGGRMKRSWVIGLIILLGMAGCGKDSSSGPEPMTAEDYVNQGWDLYEAASFNDALDSFSEAAGSDEWGREAAVGTAWAYLRLDNTASAKVSFTSAAALGTGTDLRINVGLGAIALMENNETEAILQLAAHRTGTDSWVHGHDDSVDAVDIHNILAEAYIMEGTAGTEGGSAVNDPDGWGQVKKALALDPTDEKALNLQSLLRGE